MLLPPSRFNLSMSLKTHSSFGLIFYVSDVQEDNFIALILTHGKLVYTFNVADKKVKLKTEERYNDGAWHNVSLWKHFFFAECIYTISRYLINMFFNDNLCSCSAQACFDSRWEIWSVNNWRAHKAGRHRSGRQRSLECQRLPLHRRRPPWKSSEEYSGGYCLIKRTMWGKQNNLTLEDCICYLVKPDCTECGQSFLLQHSHWIMMIITAGIKICWNGQPQRSPC